MIILTLSKQSIFAARKLFHLPNGSTYPWQKLARLLERKK